MIKFATSINVIFIFYCFIQFSIKAPGICHVERSHNINIVWLLHHAPLVTIKDEPFELQQDAGRRLALLHLWCAPAEKHLRGGKQGKLGFLHNAHYTVHLHATAVMVQHPSLGGTHAAP